MVDSKKATPKKATPKKAAPKKDAPKKDTPKKTEEKSEKDVVTQEEIDESSDDYTNHIRRIRDLANSVMSGEIGRGDERKEVLGDDYYEVMNTIRGIRTGRSK